MITRGGEAPEKAIGELLEKMNIFEEEMKKLLPNGVSVTEVQNLGLLDILVGAVFSPYKAQEEVAGVQILDPEKKPTDTFLGHCPEPVNYSSRVAASS